MSSSKNKLLTFEQCIWNVRRAAAATTSTAQQQSDVDKHQLLISAVQDLWQYHYGPSDTKNRLLIVQLLLEITDVCKPQMNSIVLHNLITTDCLNDMIEDIICPRDASASETTTTTTTTLWNCLVILASIASRVYYIN